ncbi:hypothetical protein EHM69_08020 [candidate division KSB1 bacterium]|nr:MAG: hypothetical protein EHM69_08020 [candidate division KSB1 bacterium]
MASRDEILLRLLEPYATLSSEEWTEAEALAVKDQEIATALRECKAMSALDESGLFGQPDTSDAVFLVSLRDRLSKSSAPKFGGVFGTARQAALVSSVCVVLLVAMMSPHSHIWVRFSPLTEQSVENVASALETVQMYSVDSLVQADVEPESLALYLDVPELAEDWGFNAASEEPLTDMLLALDDQSLEEVLYNLEHTRFF